MDFGLRNLMMAEKDVFLNNTFRGVPIKHKGIIRMANQDFVALDIHPQQCISLKYEKHTIFTSKYLPEILRARLTDLIPNHGTAVFSDLKVYLKDVATLAQTRLSVAEQISCDIKLPKMNIKAKVLDFVLDQKHNCLLHVTYPDRIPLQVNEEVILAIFIPSTESMGVTPGKLLQIYKVQGHHPAWRYRFSFSLSTPAIEPVKSYLDASIEQIKRDLAKQVALLKNSFS